MTATEYVVLVDEQDREIGTAEKLLAHQNNLLHRAFSIFIFRQLPQPELLLQQRALHKYHSGGLWTNTCCSHPRADEPMLSAGQRRLQEEFGFTTALKDVGWFHYQAQFANGLTENEIDHVLVGILPADVSIQINRDEIHAYRWEEFQALEKELAEKPEQFTAWFEQAFAMCKDSLEKC